MLFASLKYLLRELLNEANFNLFVFIICAMVCAGFMLLRNYCSKQKMIAAGKLLADARNSEVDSFSYKRGITSVTATFKDRSKANENNSGRSYLRRA